MENLEIIVSIAAAAISLLAACVTFIVKFVRKLKAMTKLEKKDMLRGMLISLVETAEELIGYSGSEKKAYVLKKTNEFAKEIDADFDATEISDNIEVLIELTKLVNYE